MEDDEMIPVVVDESYQDWDEEAGEYSDIWMVTVTNRAEDETYDVIWPIGEPLPEDGSMIYVARKDLM